MLFGGRKPQAEQGDAGQARAKRPGTGDEQADAAPLAKGGLKIRRFAERQYDAAGIFPRRDGPGAGCARRQPGNVLPLSRPVCGSRFALDYAISAKARFVALVGC